MPLKITSFGRSISIGLGHDVVCSHFFREREARGVDVGCDDAGCASGFADSDGEYSNRTAAGDEDSGSRDIRG